MAQLRTIEILCALFKAYSGERSWRAILEGLRRFYSLSSVVHVRKIRVRKQRTDIGKCSVVNRNTKKLEPTTCRSVRNFLCKPQIFRNRVREAVINGAK